MNDDQYFLANAYFDGELTDDQLRIAEADPDVMSEVDHLHSLQLLLRDGDPPPAVLRNAAILAAMAEFTPLPATNPQSSLVNRANVSPITRHRRRSGRMLGVAAAIAAVGAAGLVVAGVISNDSDQDSSGDLSISTEAIPNLAADARAASPTTLAAPVATGLETEASADQMLAESAPAADTATGESATTGANDVATVAAAEEMSATTEMTTVVSPSAAASTLYPTSGGPIEPVTDRDQTITTSGELAGLGVLLADLQDAGTLGATPESSCLFDDPAIEIVDTTRYRFADTTSTVLVALVASDIEGHTLAIDPQTCDILVVGP